MEIKALINRFTVYQYVTFFLLILIFTAAFFYGFGASSLIPVLIAALTTTILDTAIEYFKTKRLEFPQSAMISGLFIGGLLTQNLSWYVYVLAGAIAIISKHAIRFKGRHIFNPAILGILTVSIIFGAAHSWWIASQTILVIVFGLFIIYRLRRFDLSLSFLAAYFLLNSIFLMINGAYNDIWLTILNGGVIYFFSTFMLIEPKTHPAGKKQRVIYGILVGILLAAFSKRFPQHDILIALAVGNIFVPILNKIR